MVATKTKKAPAKKPVAKKPVGKKAAPKKSSSKLRVSRPTMVARRDEYTQLTWILICIWLVLIAVFLGTVAGQMS